MMINVMSTVVDYYGYLHLTYYSSQQFIKQAESKKVANDSIKAEESVVMDDRLYLWLSKW
jgi:hypothetical protein